MRTRELLWAVTYGWNRWAYRGNTRQREIALDEATESVADFDEFFFTEEEGPPEDVEPVKRPPLEEAWEITDPVTWKVEDSVYRRWREMHHWRPDDERASSAIRHVISRCHYVKTLGANRELWRASRHAGSWRLIVEPREGAESVVVWVGQGATPERYL
jgi:hypothetical protein